MRTESNHIFEWNEQFEKNTQTNTLKTKKQINEIAVKRCIIKQNNVKNLFHGS